MKRLLLGFIVISLSVCIYNLKTGLADDNAPNLLSSHEDSLAVLQDEALEQESDEMDPYAIPTPDDEEGQYSDEEKDDQGSDEDSDEDDEEEGEEQEEDYLY